MTIDYLEWGALLLAAAFFALLYYLDRKRHVDFGVRTILALGLGIVVGLAFKGHYTYVAAVGTIYAHVISAVVVPLLIFSITASITNLSSSIRLKNIGLKTVLFLELNTLIASIITLLASIATNIGDGFVYELATDYEATEVPTFVDTIISLFPQNLASHWADGEVVPIVLFVILVALSYNALAAENAEQVAPFKAFIDAGNRVMGKVVSIVIGFTPYAVLSLVARAVSRNALSDLLPLLSVLVLAYVLCAVQLFLVEGVLLRVIGHLNPIAFFKGIWPAGVVAFTSQSSVGTIPVTVNQLTKKLGVNEDIASFVASLGANLGMPGCAGVWPVLLSVFAVHILGLEYSAAQYAFLVVLAVVVSVGTVGVPGTATITATAVFAAAGLPVEVIVLLSPISSIVDMARTATNVVGAATAATLVAATEEGQLNHEVYDQNLQGKKSDRTIPQQV
ncbi:MAG: dicarboxylate/amino acid:cation symporter [Clostridiales bacterium]|nr:dicarboxylate/amino acid:cation symporter [Clostridiales bacterium]